MTRIIGGLVGSRKLASPAKSTRPTSDRIRESIFSSLESKDAMQKASVLDLYAVCIQNSRLIQDALLDEDHEVIAKVQIQPVQKFLENNSQVFDLVFIDPPYEITNEEVEKNLESLHGSLSKNALVLVERSTRAEAISTTGYELLETKNFGDTAIYWLKRS
jgi:16S rRNA (guanine966-N2)-methyltransferase